MLNDQLQNLPEKLSLCLEALAREDEQEASLHLEDFSKETSNLGSYAIDAMAYFIRPKSIPPGFGNNSSQKEIEKSTLGAINFITKKWNLESTNPWLALKAYCLTSNTEGVKRVINKVNPEDIMNNKALTGEPPLADNANTNNGTITKLLLQKGAWRGTSSLRLAVRKAAGLNHREVLQAILKNAPKTELDPTILRDGLIQSMIGKSTPCYKTICNYADQSLLETWINQVRAMQEQHTKDRTYPSYKEELKIITNEIATKEMIHHFDTKSQGNQLQALTIS